MASIKRNSLYSTILAGVLAAGFTMHAATGAMAQEEEAAPEDVAAARSPIALHDRPYPDMGIYARDLYLAYIAGPDQAQNRIAEAGLMALATQAYLRTSIEPAGVVALDIERDDILLFPFIYFPVYDGMPELSDEARQRLREHTARQGHVIIDLVGPTSLQTSEVLRQLISDLQVRAVETAEAGHPITQSFYIIDEQPGANNRIAIVERAPEDPIDHVSAFIIGDANWAGAWSSIMVGPDVAEDSIRSGLNMLFYVMMGTYKIDDIHLGPIDQKREFIEQARAREEEAAAAAAEAAGTTPPQP